jgi:hypothetical protein
MFVEQNGSKTLHFGNNNFSHGMMAAIKNWWDESLGGKAAYAADTGAANAYAVAPTPAITDYAAGQTFSFFAVNANNGAATLDVNALGAKTIQKNGAALVSGDIGSGDLVSVVYDGIRFQLLSVPLNLSLKSLITSGGLTIGDDQLMFEGGKIAFRNNDSHPSLYRSNTSSGSAPFSAYGNLVLESRAMSGLGVFVVTGATPAVAMEVDSSQNIIMPNGRVKIGGAATITPDTDADDIVIDTGWSATGLTIASTARGSIFFGSAGDPKAGRIVYEHAGTDMEFYVNNVRRGFFGGGLVVGSPSGGDRGAGAINAQSVYDDNALLTCYVTDMIIDGAINQAAWDDRVPDRNVPAVTTRRRKEDERGEPVFDADGQQAFEEVELEPARTETRTHEPAARFTARADRSLDPDLFYADMLARRALPALPTREEWSIEPPSVGTQVQALIETIELLVEHDNRQGNLIKGLTARVSTLEGV